MKNYKKHFQEFLKGKKGFKLKKNNNTSANN